MDWKSLIAILAANAVAIVAVLVGWRQQQQTLKQGRVQFDLENLRSILDETAIALHETSYALDGVRLNLTQFGADFFANEQRSEPFENLRVAGRRLDNLVERLKVRLDPSHIVIASIESASDAALEIFRAVERIQMEPPAEGDDPRQAGASFDQNRQATIDQREAFDSARGDFITAAQYVAGTKLS